MEYYRLNEDKYPVACTWEEWHEWEMNQPEGYFIVEKTYINEDVEVSTVFLHGISHFHEETGRPILWETMVFGTYDDHMRRYTSYDDAVLGHVEVVSLVKEEMKG